MTPTPRGPNPVAAGWSILRSLATTKRPDPAEGGPAVDHSPLATVLSELAESGVVALPERRADLMDYRAGLETVDPDALDRSEALAYWLNLYNAGALVLAADAQRTGSASVLRVPGGFSRPWATVCDQQLSLDAIEHGKVRRFKDPRIHGALVCGSASCPTLRHEPYAGATLDDQLGGQMCDFFAGGGATILGGVLQLSRVLLWFGNDFTRPHRMPAFIPVTSRRVARAVKPWLPRDAADHVANGGPVAFQSYDWSLACTIG